MSNIQIGKLASLGTKVMRGRGMHRNKGGREKTSCSFSTATEKRLVEFFAANPAFYDKESIDGSSYISTEINLRSPNVHALITCVHVRTPFVSSACKYVLRISLYLCMGR